MVVTLFGRRRSTVEMWGRASFNKDNVVVIPTGKHMFLLILLLDILRAHPAWPGKQPEKEGGLPPSPLVLPVDLPAARNVEAKEGELK